MIYALEESYGRIPTKQMRYLLSYFSDIFETAVMFGFITNPYNRFRGVVVITSALHAVGLRFDSEPINLIILLVVSDDLQSFVELTGRDASA